jgi:hypothetical protein
MANKKTRNNFFKRLNHKYRVTIFNDHTYAEVISLRLTKMNVFSIIGTSAIILISLLQYL